VFKKKLKEIKRDKGRQEERKIYRQLKINKIEYPEIM
jgi:hypothetical protein